jgi:glycosyltransferase involved in cell wall biosynthesis
VPDRVIMVGAFPPPMGGAAKINAFVNDSLESLRIPVEKLDTAASTLSHRRTLGFHLERVRANAAVLIELRRKSHGALVYLAPNAGLGAWYSLGDVLAAAGRADRIVFHHHSCRYIEEGSLPVRAMIRAAGDAVHVFLSPGMARAFEARYGTSEHLVVSNARFVAEEAERPLEPRRAGGSRFGHLSNLCRDKGFFQVANAFEALSERHPDAELILAGPILEEEVGDRLRHLQARFGARISHLGPVGGDAKLAFYRDIDVFLFPTQFRQEAAPVVLYEALAAGVPCFATDRGVIAEILTDPFSAVCPRDRDFARFAHDTIAKLDLSADGGFARGTVIKARLREDAEASKSQYAKLLSLLAGCQVTA